MYICLTNHWLTDKQTPIHLYDFNKLGQRLAYKVMNFNYHSHEKVHLRHFSLHNCKNYDLWSLSLYSKYIKKYKVTNKYQINKYFINHQFMKQSVCLLLNNEIFNIRRFLFRGHHWSPNQIPTY